MKAISVSICACGKFHDQHNWRLYKNIEEVIAKKIHEEYPTAKLTFGEIDYPQYHKDKKEVDVTIKVKGQEQHPIVFLKLAKCNLCEREGTKYFEAVLQLRCNNMSVLEAAYTAILEHVEAHRTRGLFINKTDELENGFDFYMTSNKLTQVLGRSIIDHFGGKIKINPQLFTKNHLTSKDLYRVNVLIEIPSFGKGDCILYKDKVCKVEKLGRKMKLVELSTGSSLIVDYPEGCSALPKQSAYVSKTYPHLEVINPIDYQSSMIKNKAKKDYVIGERVDVILHKGIYLVE